MESSKGIYCVKTNGRILCIKTSDDLEASKKAFDSGTLFTGRLNEVVKRAKKSSFEVLKITENPEYDVWYYRLPKISRIKYKDALINALVGGKIRDKHAERAINWFCDIFTQEYSAEIDYTLDDYIMITVFFNEKPVEIYGFKGKKQPEYRIILEEE